MGLGAPSLNTNAKREPSGPPFVPTSARNGTSIDGLGRVVLGNDIGSVLAQLLNDREIPTAGFDIRMSGAGNLVIGSAAGLNGKLQLIGTANGVQFLTKLPAGQTIANPIWRITDSANTPILDINANANDNILIGRQAGVNLSTGANNTVVGGLAGVNFTTASQCLAVGGFALRFSTTGVNNTAVGFFCMGSSNVTGALNTGVGADCMQNLTSGGSNTGIGEGALGSLTSGIGNTASGLDCLRGITGSNNNTAMGMSAGAHPGSVYTQTVLAGNMAYFRTTGGDRNSVYGFSAAANVIAVGTGHGNDNVVMGNEALRDLNMGSRNIIIGASAHIATAVGSDTITVGYNVQTGAGVNNTTLIGNTMNTTLSNVVGIGIATQNVLIGFTALAVDNGNRLQINGTMNTADPGAGAGAMKFGTVVAAASVLDAANYWEVEINGVVKKVALIV